MDALLRSLVEPVRRPRFHESVLRPWLARGRDVDDDDDAEDEDGGSQLLLSLDPSRYREFQLVGSDEDDDKGAGAGAHTSPLARVLSLLTSEASAKTNTETPHDNDDDDDDDDDGPATLQSLLSFLFSDAPEILILWLSRSRFLACGGPAFHCALCRDASDYPVFNFWFHYRDEYPPEFEAVVEVSKGNAYSFRLGGSPKAPSGARIGVEEEEGRWPAALAALLSRAPGGGASLFGCDFDVGRHLSCLESIVALPPPPGGRALAFNGAKNVTEEAARVMVRRTHPDTEIIVSLKGWGKGSVAELAGALKDNACPKHLTLNDAVEEGVVEVLAPAIRAATAVEVLEVLFPSTGHSEAQDRSDRLMLDAIRDNAGLRKLVVRRLGTVSGGFMRDFWTTVLASQTLRCVDASFLARHPHPRPSAEERREASRHVAGLLKSNRIATDLQHEDQNHDAAVWNAEVLPLLQLNRLRAAAPDLGPILSAVLAADPVRPSPMLTYQALRSSAGTLARRLLMPSSRSSSVSS